MKKVTFFAAAAAVTALVATPVLAQDTVQPRSGIHAKTYKSKHHMKTSSRMYTRDAGYMRTTDRWDDRDDWNNRGTGFWPADVVGGAVATAGAIAAAPFGGPAYNDRYYHGRRYSDAGSYPYGNRHRYGASYASMNAGGWDDPGYVGAYTYNGIAIAASPSYDARNGFTCRPGSITRLGNQQVICQ
jgi:hypothetical protein